MKTPVVAIALCLSALAPAHAAMTVEDCTAAWTAADANADGQLNADESARYVAAMRVADQSPPVDGAFTQHVFLENCSAGYFDVAAVEPGAPFEGANSFTEGQAQDRILAAGYTSVSTLVQDDAGIWRGTASMQGKPVNVAVDYKGNVVATDR